MASVAPFSEEESFDRTAVLVGLSADEAELFELFLCLMGWKVRISAKVDTTAQRGARLIFQSDGPESVFLFVWSDFAHISRSLAECGLNVLQRPVSVDSLESLIVMANG